MLQEELSWNRMWLDLLNEGVLTDIEREYAENLLLVEALKNFKF